jgi:hypothetical protein
MLNGTPIETSVRQTFRFANGALQSNPGASREFIAAYASLGAAIRSSDRAAAEKAMQGLKPTNLYESSYLGLATALFASQWGTPSQQLEGLRRAIGNDKGQHYLPPDLYKAALLGRALHPGVGRPGNAAHG